LAWGATGVLVRPAVVLQKKPKKNPVTELKMLGQNIQTWFSKF
jgi:hypothetical protein